MATWIAINSVRMTYNGQAILIREGDLVSDTAYDITKLRAAGLQLMPQSDSAAATLQAQAAAQLLRGNADDSRRDQPTWGPYMLKKSVTIANTSANVTWTFDEPEPDANYTVLYSLTGVGGTANTLACPAKSVTKANTGVTLTLVTAPGASNSVTYDVCIVR